MTISVGSVHVDVVPSTETFAEKLKAKLQGLSVKLGVDTAEASAKVDAIRAKIDSITGHARVDMDTGAASAKVEALKAQMAELRDKNVNISDGGSSAATIFKVTAIGAAILALIPIAAAASIAIAGIGVGIAAGIAGLLVGGLALGGVGAATKAGATPGQGAAGAQQQAQAQQNITAAVQAHKDAVIALTVAERDAKQAEKDLTQARLDAAQKIQDLTNAVADNQLAQRQAALDTANAALNLRVAKASPDAQNPLNANALAQVQLAYDQAKQKQLELSQAGDQATQAAAKANQLGVDGAQNVVAAQNKVIDSTNNVAKAQFTVQDTAQKVALAQGAAASQTSAYGAALAKLDPAQKAFVAFLLSIKPQFDQLKAAATNGFLPLLQKAIESLLPVMPQLVAIVGNVATAFGNLAVKSAAFFSTPEGLKFLAFIRDNIGPAIETFGRIFGGLFQIAAGFFEQAYPLIQAFGNALASALGGAAGGVQGGALNGFFAYIKENAPVIKETLKAIAGAFVSILKSLAPLGGPALKVIGELAGYFAEAVKFAAPFVKILIPFTPIILGLVLAYKAWEVVQAAVNFLMDANPIGLIIIAIAALAIGIFELVKHWQAVVEFLGGPWGTAISAAIAVIFPFIGIPLLIIGHWDAIKGFFVGLWRDVTGAITTGITAVLTFFTTAKNDLGLAWHAIWDSLSGVAIAAFDGVAGAIKSTINGVIDLINGAIKLINSDLIDIANQVPFVDIPHIPTIKHLAAGGPVMADQPYVVGDGGKPELFVPAQNGYVHPDANQAMANGHGGKQINQTNNFNGITDPNVVIAGVSRRLQFASA